VTTSLEADPQIRTQRAAKWKPWPGYGIPEAEIAKVLEIEPDKLRELYGKVIDGARTKANAKVAERFFRTARRRW
jgi:hypothetical protein